MEIAKPIVVAGPCSVESREQFGAVVEGLVRVAQVSVVRCGVWKPRTRPGGFEGLGETALQWVAEVAAKYGRTGNGRLRFVCEVALPEHVALAVQYGMDGVWVGARTTANPFLVQELAEALRGTAMTVMVKNAPSPDVRLWMGAIERFRKVGIEDVAAVHRGFDVFHNGSYRNNPLWEVPIELRRQMPEVALLSDPSHIGGSRERLLELSQTAMDLGFDGLMVEVHPCPAEALTDTEQQVTPRELEELLGRIVLRQSEGSEADEQLRLLRGQIDRIDNQLLQVLADRIEVSGRIAKVKAMGNMAVFQPKRWDTLLQQRMVAAEQLGLDSEFVRELFSKIHAESVRVQRQVFDN